MSNNCSSTPTAVKTLWYGEKAVLLRAGVYEALLIPGIGANLISLRDVKRNLDLIRTPNDIEVLKTKYKVYGMPVLFPPARIQDGSFKVNGRIYNLPINEPKNNNHLHGFLCNREWQVTNMEASATDAKVGLTFISDSSTDIYEYFPHEFKYEILYTLSDSGLEQNVKVINMSSSPMPLGLGFHTAFNVPFHGEGKGEDYTIRVSVGEEWEIGQRFLPTGKLMPLNETTRKYREEGNTPQGTPIFEHFTAVPMKFEDRLFHGAVIEDKAKGLQLVYEVGEGYKHWVIWNDMGDKGFICPEPQTWAVNAPNINLPQEVTGFRLLNPGEACQDTCKVYMRGR